MIVLITSTCFPIVQNGANDFRSLIDPKDRVFQTKETIKSLVSNGFDHADIYLVDNSPASHREEIGSIFFNINYLPVDSIQFDNKGLSELFLIQAGLQFIPNSKPILKLSGRYQLQDDFRRGDFEFTLEHPNVICKKGGTDHMSTRCYAVGNSTIYKEIVRMSINYFLNYNSRIIGPGSLKRIIKRSYSFSTFDKFHVELMLEVVMWRVILSLSLKNFQHVKLLKDLHIKGILCNTENKELSIFIE